MIFDFEYVLWISLHEGWMNQRQCLQLNDLHSVISMFFQIKNGLFENFDNKNEFLW